MSLADRGQVGRIDVTKRVKNWVDKQRSARASVAPSLFPELEPAAPLPVDSVPVTKRQRLHVPDFEPVRPRAPRPFGCQTKTLVSDQIQEPTSSEKLAQRGASYERGLSNNAYLAAACGTQNLRLNIRPGSVKFSFSDDFDRLPLCSKPQSVGCKRGFIKELSDASRNRLASKAADLQAVGHVPEIMITLTSPANWRDVYVGTPLECSNEFNCNIDLIINKKTYFYIKHVNYISYKTPYSNYLCSTKAFGRMSSESVFMNSIEGGREFKRHMAAFRKRLDLKLRKLMIDDWSALWFLEFQKRGAPHIHLMIFNCDIPVYKRVSLREWLGLAWAEIVGNPIEEEFNKHVKAGTKIEKMRKRHFGYAMKYASKMEQKQVPSEFKKVGRFWGVWNVKMEPPIEIDLDFNRFQGGDVEHVASMVFDALSEVVLHSEHFVSTRWRRFYDMIQNGLKHKFGFTVYGEDATKLVVNRVGSA